MTVSDGEVWAFDGAQFRVRNRNQSLILLAYDLLLTCVVVGPNHNVGDCIVEKTETVMAQGTRIAQGGVSGLGQG